MVLKHDFMCHYLVSILIMCNLQIQRSLFFLKIALCIRILFFCVYCYRCPIEFGQYDRVFGSFILLGIISTVWHLHVGWRIGDSTTRHDSHMPSFLYHSLKTFPKLLCLLCLVYYLDYFKNKLLIIKCKVKLFSPNRFT